jgi:hypothetical protein
MKAYQAYATGGFRVTAENARSAAEQFFAKFPTKRKCNVIEGETDGPFFTIRYGNPWPTSYKDVTKKTAGGLPA